MPCDALRVRRRIPLLIQRWCDASHESGDDALHLSTTKKESVQTLHLSCGQTTR